MMPSRGWQLARGSTPRLYQLQCRNLSSASRRIPPSSHRNSFSRQRTSQQWRTSTPLLSSTHLAIRHASTSPQTAAEVAASSSSEAAAAGTTLPAPFPNVDTINFDDIDLETTASIVNIPERIGYLKEIGLDYGWGPTSMLQWVIEHIHVWGGVPWWGSVAATAVLIRLVLFPLYLKSSDMTARQQALTPLTKPITDRMTAAQRSKDQQAVMQAWTELSSLRSRAGINFRDQFAPIICQGVIAYCGFKLIRAMSYLPVPGFKDGGFLWLQDLTLSDPYLILPAIMALSIHFLIRMGGETGAATTDAMNAGMVKFMKYAMPTIVFFATGWQPGAVCVWFSAGGVLGIGQSLLLQQPALRERFGLAPMYKPGKGEGRGMGSMSAIAEGMRPAPKPAASSASGAEGRSEWSYQSPNLRRSASNRTFKTPQDIIDVKAVTKASTSSSTPNSSNEDMVQPGARPTGGGAGVFERASAVWNKGKEKAREFSKATEETEEKRKERIKELERKRAESYEQRAQVREKEKKKGKR